MSENLLQSLQQLVQDVIAPDVRELKVRMGSLEKQIDVRFDAVNLRFESLDQRFASFDRKNDARFKAVEQRFEALDQRLDSSDQKHDAQFKALMSAIGESRAQSELTNVRLIAALSERVAVLESKRH